MKKFLLILFAVLLLATPTSAANSNAQRIYDFCRKTYPGKQLFIVPQEKVNYKQFTHRKGKRYVYIIKYKAKSRGHYGYTKSGSYIRFNKSVKKGKWVDVFYIYSPYTNADDAVVARVSNNKIVTFS